MKWVFGTKEEEDISRLFILNDLNCCVAPASQQMVIDNSFSINIDASLINNTSIIVMICLTSIHVLTNVPYGSCYVLRRNKGDDSCDGIIHVLLVFLLISMLPQFMY